MVAMINKMEISLPSQFLKEKGFTLSTLLNPFKLRETLNILLADVPREYMPISSEVHVGTASNGLNLTYELNRTQLGNGGIPECEAPELDINGELHVETLLDQTVFAVNENPYCRTQTLTFNSTPVQFVRKYLENEDCRFSIRILNPNLFEVTITPAID